MVDSAAASLTALVSQTPLLSFQTLSGYPVIGLDGTVGTNYSIESKNSLTDPSWTPLLNFNLTANPFTLFDTTASGAQRRFYRGVAH